MIKPSGESPTKRPKTANAIVLEMAIQQLLQRHRLTRRKARGIARTMLKRFAAWED